MRTIPWILVTVAASVLAVATAAGSCAIDDEPTWITDTECSGCRSQEDLSSFECDTDSSCTRVDGCVDWDCASGDGADGDGGDTVPPDGGVRDVPAPDTGDSAVLGEDAAGGGDVDGPPDPTECEPSGGGVAFESAEPLEPNEVRTGLLACAFPSRWFSFTADAGERFEVVLQPAEGQLAEFLLYAEDESLVASAEMDEDASFAADAGRTATYYLRVRGVGPVAVEYSLVVRTTP